MKPKRISKFFVFAGLLLIVTALCLTVYNLNEQTRAVNSAQDALQKIEKQIEEYENNGEEFKIPDYLLNANIQMPEIEINGQMYVGIVSIPTLNLRLPVLSDWSYSKLKISPCRFQGSAYSDDLIVMAHNYTRHFGALSNLQPGDEIYFEDMDKNLFYYKVAETQILDGTDIEHMVSGDWDLTLFTCTIGGKSRVTVRCERIES